MKEELFRSIRTKDLKMIGHGATSNVFMLDADKVVKAYHPWMDPAEIEREFNVSRLSLYKGVPTAEPFEIVRTEEGYGIIYEYIRADTMAEAICKNPGELESMAVMAADLLRRLHKEEFNEGQFKTTVQMWKDLCDLGLAKYLTDSQNEILNGFLAGVPSRNAYIHGDYHPLNIMVRDGELILIDVGDASIGAPVFDLASVYMACIILPAKMKDYVTLSPEQWHDFWEVFFSAYKNGPEQDDQNVMISEIRRLARIRRLITYVLSHRRDINMTFLTSEIQDVIDDLKEQLT